MNASVTTDQNGNRDESAAKANNATNKSMMIVMPLMSLFIGYSYPAALSLYWLVQGLFGIAQDAILTARYRKIYDAEDEVKRRLAAQKAAEEAERERLRALRRAENPDGIMENTSKKKLQKQQQFQKEQQQAAMKRANAEETGKTCPCPATRTVLRKRPRLSSRPLSQCVARHRGVILWKKNSLLQVRTLTPQSRLP